MIKNQSQEQYPEPLSYTITLLQSEDFAAYSQFVQSFPEALYEHSLEIMTLIEKFFKFQPKYIIAKEGPTVIGALPLFRARSILEGTRYVSLPFFPFGGVIGINVKIKKMLLEKAKELSLDGKFLEIRQREFLEPDLASGFVKQSPITDFVIELKKSEEEMLGSFSKDIRYDIRKAQKNNLHVIISKDHRQLADFYQVYLNTRKRRGVPAWPYGLFKEALKTCPTVVAVTYIKDRPIAAAFLFSERETIEYAFAGTDYRYNSLSPYYLLLWEIIKYAIARNYRFLDLGGSTKEMNDGNMYAFKQKWATVTREIPYYFYATNQQNIPSLEKSFGLYRIYGKVWSLLPKRIIKIISPVIIRQFK